MYLFKSFIYNVSLLISSVGVALFVKKLEILLNINFITNSLFVIKIGLIFLIIGFLIRIYTSYIYYKKDLEVFNVKPQRSLIFDFPFSISRNPLYIGLIFFAFGSSLLNVSILSFIGAIIFTVFAHVYVVKFEERDLEKKFGDVYKSYKQKVRRWV